MSTCRARARPCQRTVAAITTGNQEDIVFAHLHSTEGWMYRISGAGTIKKAVHIVKGENPDISNSLQTSSQVAAEEDFWSDWLATHTNSPGVSTNAPRIKP